MIDILVFGAHPDDIEFGCGAYLAKCASKHQSIYMADCTLGEMGTHGSSKIRAKEAQNAAKLIGAQRTYLGFSDCKIFDNPASRTCILDFIEKHPAKLILAPFWKGTQTHPDHLACGSMVYQACIQLGIASTLLFYIFPNFDHGDLIIDVSPHIDKWKEIMECHKSQLQTNHYIDWNLRLSSKWGLILGTDYAQAFIHPGRVQSRGWT